jgi:hypothetical protein
MSKWLFIGLLVLASNVFAASDDVRLFSLYPVPLKSSRIYVRLQQSNTGISTVEIRSLIGKKIQSKQLRIGEVEIAFDDMDANPNGVYVVVAKDANGKVLEINKFVLNK